MPSPFRRALAGVLVLGLALVACTGSTPSARRHDTPAPSASPTPPPPPPPPIAPLTGLEVASAAIARRPALAVKIDNHTDARPQVGLDRADVVYEEPVEGGITRFIAIFQSRDASKVGPIRSARLTDIDVLAQYGKPLLAFSGAAHYVIRAVGRANLVSMRQGQFPSVYRRDGSRSAPHNLFASTPGLFRLGSRAHPSPAPALFDFGALLAPPPVVAPSPSPSESPTATPTPAWPSGRTATIPFAGSAWRAVWRWSSSSGTYLRWHGTAPHRAASGTQISAANVIVMRVATQRNNSQAAAHGTPELRLVGSGAMVLLRNGVRIVGRWTRSSLTAPTRFVDKLGRQLTLAPGTTWIELVPTRIVPKYA
jgi:DUF3048 family protein